MNPNQSLYRAVAQTALEHPHNRALYLMGTDVTYSRLIERIDRTAGGLVSLGIRQGDIVTICMPNVLPCIYVFYACNKIGAICHMVHPLTPANQMERFLEETDSHFLFILDSFHDTYAPLLKRGDLRIVLCSPVEGLSPVKRLFYPIITRKKLKNIRFGDRVLPFSGLIRGKGTVPEASRDPKAGSILLHSGGTSGKPKTIELSDFAVNSLGMKADYILGTSHLTDQVMLAVLPMFHGFGLCMGVHALLCFGGGDALMPKFNAAETIDLLKKNRVHFIIGVPTLFEALLSHPDFAGDHLRNLKQAFVGGDFVSPALKAHFDSVMEKFGSQARMLEGYGLTEVVTVCAVNTLTDHLPDTVGRPLPGMTIKIVDLETREDLPLGRSGEIAVSGDTRMIGYYQDPETNAKTFLPDAEGNLFVLTGDYGHLGENGHLYFQQRLKRIIKVSGIPVMPSEVETLVTALPGVAEAAATAVDDAERGHRIKLFIRMKKDAPGPLDESVIRQRIKAELSIFAVPKTIVFLTEMPHTLVGKIDIPTLEKQEKDSQK